MGDYVCPKTRPICVGFDREVKMGKCTEDPLAPIKSRMDKLETKVNSLPTFEDMQNFATSTATLTECPSQYVPAAANLGLCKSRDSEFPDENQLIYDCNRRQGT